MVKCYLLFDESLFLIDGFRSLTLLLLINLDFPVLPVMLPCFCGATDTKIKRNKLHNIFQIQQLV